MDVTSAKAGAADSGENDLLLDPFERVSATEHVARVLREAILAGRIKQGEPMRELRLARLTKTGRGVVREALRQLVQEGLVEYHVHRGTFVKVITTDDLVDVYRAREAIEIAAVAAARSADPLLDFTALERQVAAMQAVAEREDGSWPEMVDADVAFHEALVALAGSPRLVRVYATLAAEMRMHLCQYPPYPTQQNAEDHERILAALKERRDEAVSLLREHLRFSCRLAVDWRTPRGA